MEYIDSIVTADLWQAIKDKQLMVVATSVLGRLRVIRGSTYNCYNLEVKLSDGTTRTLAKGFRRYGYDREYINRAEKVLKLCGLEPKIDFYHSDYVKASEMFNYDHYKEDVKLGWMLDITKQLDEMK